MSWREGCRKAQEPTLRCRSEEHTSELQSRSDLVCRLLLEKQKPQPAGMQRQTTGPIASGTTVERPFGVTIIRILQNLGAIGYILVRTVFGGHAPIIGLILL